MVPGIGNLLCQGVIEGGHGGGSDQMRDFIWGARWPVVRGLDEGRDLTENDKHRYWTS